MSPSIPPNSSSETAAGGEQEEGSGASLTALVTRLAEEFGADADSLASVAATFAAVRERAPDVFVPAPGALGAAFDSGDAGQICAAVGEWALDAENEPIERMRRDCLRFLNAMTRGALRIHADDAETCTGSLVALQRFSVMQLAVLASLAARSQEGGGVVRTLPTPEYASFMEIFRGAIEAHRQEGKSLGLLLIHVTKVEQVDRLLGLQRGEAFMLRVTRRMREGVLRRQDQLGRVSRDQFACLLPRIAGEGVAILAANKVLGALDAPIPIGDRSFAPEAVIGIAMYPDHGSDPQTLVRNGKLAATSVLGTADRYGVYDPAQGESEERKVRYESRLRYSLEQGALSIAFEPQIDLASGAAVGLEAVMQWHDAELGEVPEETIIEAGETGGLTREVVWWAFNNALRQHAGFARAGVQLTLSLKVSASGIAQPDFVEFVDRALRTWGVAAGQVIIHVHESALAANVETPLAGLKALGVGLALDGFGSGGTSLASLGSLPFDELQLDASRVSGMLKSDLDAKIVDSLVHLARNFGLRVGARGVADEATARALGALGCERAQGAHAGPPLAAADVLAKFAATPAR